MELQMFEHSAYGVSFRDLRATALESGDRPVSSTFYGELFAEVEKRGAPSGWVALKQTFGADLHKLFMDPWAQEHGRAPRVLAVGAGTASAESIWAERGCEVTFHDGHDSCFPALKARFPSAKFEVAELRNYAPSGPYDIITLLSIDCPMTRAELHGLVQRCADALSPGGKIILSCPNILTWRRLAIECARRVGILRRPQGSVFWGWWRSPREFSRAGHACSLRVSHVSWDVNGVILKQKVPTMLPLRNSDAIFLYEHEVR